MGDLKSTPGTYANSMLGGGGTTTHTESATRVSACTFLSSTIFLFGSISGLTCAIGARATDEMVASNARVPFIHGEKIAGAVHMYPAAHSQSPVSTLRHLLWLPGAPAWHDAVHAASVAEKT